MSRLKVAQAVDSPMAGDTLPNGATVIDAVLTSSEAHEEGTYYYGYVLAQRNGEFITWRLGIKPDGEIVTSGGHYTSDINKAVVDYNERKARA